jgi:hypothetical protein
MTVYVLFVDRKDGQPEVCCGVFTSEDAAFKHTWEGYAYRVETYVLDAHS